MKTYDIIMTERAMENLEMMYEYISDVLLAPESAKRQYERIVQEISNLCTFPERFQLFPAKPKRLQGLRRMVIDRYSVFYKIEKENVIVMNVLYNSLDLKKIFSSG